MIYKIRITYIDDRENIIETDDFNLFDGYMHIFLKDGEEIIIPHSNVRYFEVKKS